MHGRPDLVGLGCPSESDVTLNHYPSDQGKGSGFSTAFTILKIILPATIDMLASEMIEQPRLSARVLFRGANSCKRRGVSSYSVRYHPKVT